MYAMYARKVIEEDKEKRRFQISKDGTKHKFLIHCVKKWGDRRP